MWSLFKKRDNAPKGVYEAAYDTFLNSYTNYSQTHHIDELRDREFDRLDKQGHVYIDFTGGGLYAAKQVREHADKLASAVYGNPHSSNPTSQKATDVTESARDYVLKYFNTNRSEYVCIFTPNASGALKLLGESYPFDEGSHFLLTFDNHNSVNGIREFARGKGASYNYSPIRKSDLRLDEEALMRNLDQPVGGKNKLFAFPAQSNVSGVKHPLKWIDIAKSKGWDVLLDAAAFVPSDRLDLSKYKPDFVSVSFYKIFGYPTGLGCLLVKREAFDKLLRPWFAGGTITIVSVQGDSFYYDKDNAKFEDGTINYLDIPAIEIGLRHIESVGIDAIKSRISCITGWTLEEIHKLKHSSGKNLITVYGPQDATDRGGTIAMNFFDEDGEMYDFYEIEKVANGNNISLRTGCFCNPGIDETNHAFGEEELKKYFAKAGPKNYFDLIADTGKRRGAVRISYGYVSRFSDAYKFIEFAKTFLNKKRRDVVNN